MPPRAAGFFYELDFTQFTQGSQGLANIGFGDVAMTGFGDELDQRPGGEEASMAAQGLPDGLHHVPFPVSICSAFEGD